MMNVKQKKVFYFLWIITTVFSLVSCSYLCQQDQTINIIPPQKTDYPHWNFDNKSTYNKLVKINTFIEKNKNKGYIATFDWDGTLYNENIPVKELNNAKYAGQPAWYMWMAFNKSKFSFPVFPMFNTKDGEFKSNVITHNQYLEGHTNIEIEGYSKFISTAIFTAYMTPENVTEGIMEFLKEYKPEKYAFLPMLDVLQKFVNSGYNVWIITGSNQYFVASEIKYIEDNINYTKNNKYNFRISTAPYNTKIGHIAGNGLKLLKNNKFSVVYDDRYVKNPDEKLYIVDGSGKLIAVKNLEKTERSKVVFAAGNSGGDYYIILYVAEQPDTLSIAVEPRGSLPKLVKKYSDKIVQLNSDEI